MKLGGRIIFILFLFLSSFGIAFLQTNQSCLVLSEIFPNPLGKDFKKEWLEIFNQCLKEVDLYHFKIKDKSQKIFEIKQHLILKPKSFFVIFPNPKLILNNDQEKIFLLNPKNEIIDEISYDFRIPQGVSFCKFKNHWQVCEPTFKKENKIENPKSQKNLEKDELVKKEFNSFKLFGLASIISLTLAFALAKNFLDSFEIK